MKRGSVQDYVVIMKERYRKAGRAERGRLLDEFVRVTGYHRKSGVRLLGGKGERSGGSGRTGRPREYGPAEVAALRQVWEVVDRPCGSRLAPFMEELVCKLEMWEELLLPHDVAEALCSMSASTIDRLLRAYKERGRRPWTSVTKPGSLLKAAIPIRTFGEWGHPPPGHLEVDLVAHCGESTEGFYLNTLTGVDIATGWVVCRGVWGKGQERVGGAIHEMARALPFPLLDLHTDNGGEFINHYLHAYCRRKGITFTRSRPYRKNDNAHVEQKNWTAVRRLIGYDRYATRAALERLQSVHRLAALYQNFFQPVRKLVHKSRQGARVRRIYDTAQTPYQRLLTWEELTGEARESLERRYQGLNPVRLKAQLEAALEALWATAEPDSDYQRPVTGTSEASVPSR